MDSDYGMHDTSDVELLEDIHGEETADYYYYDDDDAVDGHYDSSGNDCEVSNYSILRRKQESYTVLSEADIRQRLEDDITAISTVLSISRVAAGILLHRYNWDVSKVHEEWFADEERVRKAAGLLENHVVDTSNARELTCGICFDSLPKKDICSAACGHPFCSSCWAGYISTAINDGPGCLMLRCPDPGCAAAVGQDMIDALGSENDRKKYLRYFLRSYIEDNRKTKWCPAPGCNYAVHFSVGSGSYDVICCCSHSFCWNCTEEAHRPVDCETVSKWILKNSAESQNTKWILAYTKPCPKCSRPIEKNSGCMHMTCTPPCKFEFCWICLADWSEHEYRNACNGYGRGMQGTVDETEQQRQMARKSLQRYAHYYERWAANHLSMQKAVADLEKMQNLQLGQLSEIQSEPESQLKFIIEGWSQIVECRRVLKWTYAYGYYLPEAEHAKIQLFEYLQGEAEAGLERLHRCVEKELQVHLTEKQGPLQEFTAFRSNLENLTKVTRTYFENLVGALENGLSDVDSQTSKKGKTSEVRCASPSSSSNSDVFDYWQCERCTYANASSVTACQMCSQPDYY